MINSSDLKEHAARLTRQINLIRNGLGIDQINEKTEAIERKIGELIRDNSRLTSENVELMSALKSLISSVENNQCYESPCNYQHVGMKLDAILETGRASDAGSAVRTTAHVGSVVAEKIAVPKESQAEITAVHEQIPSGLRRGPYNP